MNRLLNELTRIAHITLADPVTAPEGWWLDRDGRAVRIVSIKPYERLREETLRPLVERHLALYLEIADLKARYYDDISALIAVCWQEHGVLLEGKTKKNATLYLFDGSFRIERKYQDRIRYNESIGAAEALVMECVRDWAADSLPEVRALIASAFERNKQGDIRRAEMIRLRQHKFDDERWQKAMAIIAEAEEMMSAACYITVSIRDAAGAYHPLPLDLASVPPHKHGGLGQPRPIRTEAEYNAALDEVTALMASDPPPGSPDGDFLEVWTALVEAYERKALVPEGVAHG